MYGDNILKTETYFHEKKNLVGVSKTLSLSLSLSLSQYNTMLDPQYMLCPILNEVTQYIFNFYIYICKKCIGTLLQFDRNVLKKYF